jgi:hypothetical protein
LTKPISNPYVPNMPSGSTIQAHNDKVALSNQGGIHLTRWDRLDNVLVQEFTRPIEDTLLPQDIVTQLKAIGLHTAGEGAIHRLLNAEDKRIVAKTLALIYGRAPKTIIHRTETPNLAEVPTSELLEQLNLTAVEQAEVVDETPNPSNNNDIDEPVSTHQPRGK